VEKKRAERVLESGSPEFGLWGTRRGTSCISRCAKKTAAKCTSSLLARGTEQVGKPKTQPHLSTQKKTESKENCPVVKEGENDKEGRKAAVITNAESLPQDDKVGGGGERAVKLPCLVKSRRRREGSRERSKQTVHRATQQN